MRAMTSYAYVREAQKEGIVEVSFKSVNSKYLDINIYRLSSGNVLLESKIKKLIEGSIFRGRVDVGVFVREKRRETVKVDKDLFYTYYSRAKEFSERLDLPLDFKVFDIFSLPGIITVETSDWCGEKIVLKAVRTAIEKAVLFREKEGAAIKKKVLGHLGKLTSTLEGIQKYKPKVTDGELGKEDIDEEVSLLSFYIKKLERVVKMNSNAVRGKTIDFLAQEILRELNTSASKTKGVKLISLIIEAKNYIERVREQAQNIE